MPDLILPALAALADPTQRAAAAERLAQSLGARAAIIFAKDPELERLLPAIGFPQTLPALAWQAFIACAAQAEARATLPFPDASSPPLAAIGVRGADGTVLVLIGGDAPAPEVLDAVRLLLPLLGAVYTNEFIAQAIQRKIEIAQDAAGHAQALAQRLDRARAELEKTIRSLKQTEDALATEKERLAVTLESIGDGVIACDTHGQVVLMNPVAETLTGWALEAARARPLNEVFNIVNEYTREPHESPVSKVLHTGETIELANHTVLIARDGTERVIADSAAPIRNRSGEIVGAVLVFRDITAKKRSEDDLIKSQRLESIGLLAGGIAHDFNNILTAIFGNIALAKLRAHADPEIVEVLDEAESAFYRARELTQQLLTFAKGGAPIRKTASLDDLIRECVNFALRDTTIRCDVYLDPSLWPVSFDASQMSQVINNLLVNAKEAMPNGGRIVLSGENITLEPQTVGPLPAGRYVYINISDEGEGIPPHLLQKIFDPYFSTKEKGSGLGLTTTYSIIKRHDGHIAVTSRPGAGTAFQIYLPAAADAIHRPSPVAPQPTAAQGNILLMDEDNGVREIARSLLVALGYDVTCAQNGDEVIALYRDALHRRRRYDCVILPLTVYQGMNGVDCLAALKDIDEKICAIATSEYAGDTLKTKYAGYGFCGALLKPYQLHTLSEALRGFGGAQLADAR